MVTPSDVLEIEQLVNRYVYLADWLNKGVPEVPGGPTRVADVFTEDAVFLFGNTTFAGLEAISGVFSAEPTVHTTSNTYVYTDGDAVRVRSKFAFANLSTRLLMLGDYDDVVVPTPDGWRIVERVVRTRTTSDLGTELEPRSS